MTACNIAKDFKEQLEPAKPFVYEDLQMIESVAFIITIEKYRVIRFPVLPHFQL